MEIIHERLADYHCTCGKLLCKGALFLSVVEVKCRRCGAINMFREARVNEKHTLSFTLCIDTQGIIIDACRAARALRLTRTTLIGQPVSTLFPLILDAPLAVKGAYDIPHNTLILKDGNSIVVESSVVPHYADDAALDGYRVFTMLH